MDKFYKILFLLHDINFLVYSILIKTYFSYVSNLILIDPRMPIINKFVPN